MTTVTAPHGSVLGVVRQATPLLNVFQEVVLSVYNVPAEEMRSSFVSILAPIRQDSQGLRVALGSVLAVITGKIDNPKLQAWTYTLDGHDFYILKLGTSGKTLVFDLSTKQWAWWSSTDDVRWRPSTGMNWRSADSISVNYGSNVITGDDSSGTLWVLDPEQGYDDKIEKTDTSPTKFPRVATGQLAISARKTVPIYSIDLSASFGYPSLTDNIVTLEYSDDQGNTYVVADQPMVSAEGNYNQEFTWRSLGQVASPGRLIRVTDDGAFARIDDMTVNE